MALAWVLQQPAVNAPVIGARRLEQVADAVAAAELALDEDELRLLGQHSVPHRPTGIA